MTLTPKNYVGRSEKKETSQGANQRELEVKNKKIYQRFPAGNRKWPSRACRVFNLHPIGWEEAQIFLTNCCTCRVLARQGLKHNLKGKKKNLTSIITSNMWGLSSGWNMEVTSSVFRRPSLSASATLNLFRFFSSVATVGNKYWIIIKIIIIINRKIDK